MALRGYDMDSSVTARFSMGYIALAANGWRSILAVAYEPIQREQISLHIYRGSVAFLTFLGSRERYVQT